MSSDQSTYNLLSVSTAARILACRPVTILRMAKRGELKHIVLHGRYKISERDLVQFIKNAGKGQQP